MILISIRFLSASFLMSIIIAMLLLSGQLSHYSFGFSSSIKQISAKDPFAKPDQITFDFFPSDQQKGPATTDDLSPPMLNSLFQGIENREICGDSKDNNKNGLVDENCSALPSSQQDSLGQLPPPNSLGQLPPPNTLGQPSEPPQDDNDANPEPEICGDGEDNDGDGAVDENCNSQPSEPPQDDNNQNPEPEICGDGEDNDGDGEVDENCNSQPPDPPQDNDANPEPEICGDGEDNDGNGAVDENCNSQPSEPPQDDNNQNPEPEICGDGEDNDGNGKVDENCSVDG